MSIRRSPTSRAPFVVVSAVIAALGGWVVPGAVADDGLSGTIHASAKDVNGQLRVVDEGDACHESEQSLCQHMATVAGSTYTDHLNGTGSAAYSYEVCAATTAVCSNQVTAQF